MTSQYECFLSPEARSAASARRVVKRANVAARTVRGVVVPTSASYAVDRFTPGGPSGYRANGVPGAAKRSTRVEAEADWLDHHFPRTDADNVDA